MNTLLSKLLALVALAAASLAAQAQDATAGHKKAAMCIGCHGIPGYQASFPEVHKVPMISGQNAAYLASALQAYLKGERKHPTMRGVAISLTEQDIADLSAYYAQHGKSGTELPAAPKRQPDARVAALLQKGACVSCHGDNFSKSIDPSYPKLAGQHADYLYAALKAYRDNANHTWGRGNPVMAGMAKQFSTPELKAMAQYIGKVQGDLQVVPQPRFR